MGPHIKATEYPKGSLQDLPVPPPPVRPINSCPTVSVKELLSGEIDGHPYPVNSLVLHGHEVFPIDNGRGDEDRDRQISIVPKGSHHPDGCREALAVGYHG